MGRELNVPNMQAYRAALLLLDQLADVQTMIDRLKPTAPATERLRLHRAFQKTLTTLQSLARR